MPGTVDDFLQRFGSRGTIDDREADQYFDRFASTDQNDRDFDNDTMYEGATEYLGKLPDNDFQQAAQGAFSRAEPSSKQSLLQGLLGGLQGRGVDLGSLGRLLGLHSTDPQGMDANDYARLANYARKEHPEVLREQVREKPWFMKALGNPVVMGALTVAAAKMLNNRTRR
jgi:hypothetical protein